MGRNFCRFLPFSWRFLAKLPKWKVWHGLFHKRVHKLTKSRNFIHAKMIHLKYSHNEACEWCFYLSSRLIDTSPVLFINMRTVSIKLSYHRHVLCRRQARHPSSLK